MSDIDVSSKKMLVFDEDTNEMVEVTPKERDYAEYVYYQLKSSILQTAAALRKIFEEKLYLGLGYNSREDFVVRGTDIGFGQAKKLVTISRKFSTYLPELDEKGQSTDLLGDGGGGSPTDLAGMGIEKLYQLTRLSDEDFEKFMKDGEIGEGENKLLMEEYRESTVRKSAEKLQQATKAFKKTISKQSDTIGELEEDIKFLESENDVLKSQKKKFDEVIDKYGPLASQLEHKEELLELGKESLDDLDRYLTKANVLADDPASLTEFYDMLLRRIEELHVKLINNYGTLPKKDGE